MIETNMLLNCLCICFIVSLKGILEAKGIQSQRATYLCLVSFGLLLMMQLMLSIANVQCLLTDGLTLCEAINSSKFSNIAFEFITIVLLIISKFITAYIKVVNFLIASSNSASVFISFT